VNGALIRVFGRKARARRDFPLLTPGKPGGLSELGSIFTRYLPRSTDPFPALRSLM
jgi:hypothetical protein